jgi:acyl dehydratase
MSGAGNKIGWRLESVPAAEMSTWSKAANDANPIHVDTAAAEALGFGPRCVNPGPANLAYLMNMLMASRPGCELVEVDASFLGNVLAGDTVEATGCIKQDGLGLCEASLTVQPEGRHVLSAIIRFEGDES